VSSVLERTVHFDVDLVNAFCDHNGVMLKKVQVNSNLSFVPIVLHCGVCFGVV